MNDKFAYFVCVNPDQNCNKFYQMKQISPDLFEASNGREGGHTAVRTYPMHKWSTKYREKLKVRNGYVYTDVTHLHGEEVGDVTTKIRSDHPLVRQFLNLLLETSNTVVKNNYKFASSKVTQKQIDEVQSLLNEFTNSIDSLNVDYLNKLLVQIFTILPRKMQVVKENLIPENGSKDAVVEILKREEELLESMQSMVSSTVKTTTGEVKYVEDSLGIEILPGNYQDLGQKQTFDILHRKHKERFDGFVTKQNNKYTADLYHGSNVTNWLSIINRGLLIKPSGVYHAGSNYGNGIYFSDQHTKSLAYTRSNPKILGVYEVHLGDIYKADYTNSSLNLESIKPKHSVNGNRIEYIVYRPEQCSLKKLLVF